MGGYYPEILRITPTRSAGAMETIGLSTPLRLGTAFRFPLQHQLARRELLWGAFLLLVLPGVGWLLNMGHRIQMVHNMQHERACWPAWVGYRHLLKLGTVTFLGMVEYHLPATFIGLLAWRLGIGWLWPIAAALGIAATVAVPGYMSHYCVEFDASEVFNPFKALRRVSQGGGATGTPGRSPSRPSPPRSPGCWPWASASWSRASGSGKWPGSASRRSSRSGSGSDRRRDGSARQSGEDDLARGPHGPPLPFVTPTDGIRL